MSADKPIERKAVSKRVRFEVFKRDCFTCQYCGAVPPTVILEVDHIVPVAEGGGNEETNLITACFNCNRGKGPVPLTVAPESLTDRAARIEEAEAQLAGYRQIVMAREERIEADCWQIINILFFTPKQTTHARFNSVRQFVGKLPLDELIDAAMIARSKQPYSDPQRFKYFCGICWRKIGALQQ